MLYLMTVLTFLAGIMFYLLSPRDDKLHLDTYQAEPLIQDLITQHQAAKDYLRQWFGANLSGADTNYFNLQKEFIEYVFSYGNHGTLNSMCVDNAGAGGSSSSTDYPSVANKLKDSEGNITQDGECFISRVICIDSSENLKKCNGTEVAIDKAYVVTYGGWGADYSRPSYWPNKNSSRVRRTERWRRAIAQRTHGSLTCGTLYEYPEDGDFHNNNWCLDNGQVTQEKRLKEGETRCVKPIPTGVIDGLLPTTMQDEDKRTYLYDMFLCISPVVQGPAHYYPSGLTHYFDGLDNFNKHAPSSSSDTTHQTGEKLWYDLVESVNTGFTQGVSGQYDSSQGKFIALSSTVAEFSDTSVSPYYTLKTSTNLDFNFIPENSDFTVSVVAALNNPADSKINLINFQGGSYLSGSDTFQDSFKVYYVGKGADGHMGEPDVGQIHFEIHHTKNGSVHAYYHFYADVSPKANRPFTLTLVRQGDTIELYQGGHESLSTNEKKLFSGRITKDEIRNILSDTTNSPFRSKMQINNLANDKPVYLYAVRIFNRALTSSDVYKLYKEDVRRYAVDTPSTYGTIFSGEIEWPDDGKQTTIKR